MNEWKPIIKKSLFFINLLSLISSAMVNFIAVVYSFDLAVKFPFVEILFVGMFVSAFTLIILLKFDENPVTAGLQIPFSLIFSNTPFWLKAFSVLSGVYILFCFAFFNSKIGGNLDILDSKYVIHNHGNILRILTENEYYILKSYHKAFLSSIWIFVYSISLAGLYPSNKK